MRRTIAPLLLSIALTAGEGTLSGESRIIPVYEFPGDLEEPLNLSPIQLELSFPLVPQTPCDIARVSCGSLEPPPYTGYIADGAYNSIDHTLFFVNVPSTVEGIFQVDPLTCSIVPGTFHSINQGISQRGIAFDPRRYQIWVGGWIDMNMNQYSAHPPYDIIASNHLALSIASAAIDPANDFLFVGENSALDMVYCYDISGGSLGSLLGSWPVPWQQETDGWDMAGMAFDDDAGQLIIINQYYSGPGEAMEAFSFSLESGLTPAGYCILDRTDFAWGLGLVDGDPTPGTSHFFTPDIYTFGPPFELDDYGDPEVLPPEGLTCTEVQFDIELEWSNPVAYDALYLERDGELVDVLAGHATYYLDRAPGAGFHMYSLYGTQLYGQSPEVFCESFVHPGPSRKCYDFNNMTQGWNVGGIADWEWGIPSYEIDGRAWETNLGDRYYDGACGWLVSPPIELGASGGWLEFDAYTYVECWWDGWNVQLSQDGGNRWTVITPVGGYDQGIPYGACSEGLDGDTNCGYREVEVWEFDLLDYANATIRIRFLFESDESIAYTGLIVDNVCVDGWRGLHRYHKEATPQP